MRTSQSARISPPTVDKLGAVLRLLNGEALQSVALEVGAPADVIASWKDRFLEFGRCGLRIDQVADRRKALKDLRQEFPGPSTVRPAEARKDHLHVARDPDQVARDPDQVARDPGKRRLIGIVGGLGPFAHIDFEMKLLESARELLGASEDQDFPEWVLCSIPQTPDRTSAYFGTAEDPVPFLERGIQRLERAGADFVVVPCNTAHLFLKRLVARTGTRLLSLIDVTVSRASELVPAGTVGVLATTGTLRSGLYHDALRAQGLNPISLLDLPDGEELQLRHVMEPIYGPLKEDDHQGGGLKTHGQCPRAEASLLVAAEALVAAGADLLILGCTEIPLALDSDQLEGTPVLDPAQVLAEATIRLVYSLERPRQAQKVITSA